MKMKINLHSIIDLITNSSTEIYTYSENSLSACKEMINEFFRVTGIDKTCDDIFELSIEADEQSEWSDYRPESFLMISCKDPEYKKLGELVRSFLYSTNQEACYNG